MARPKKHKIDQAINDEESGGPYVEGTPLARPKRLQAFSEEKNRRAQERLGHLIRASSLAVRLVDHCALPIRAHGDMMVSWRVERGFTQVFLHSSKPSGALHVQHP